MMKRTTPAHVTLRISAGLCGAALSLVLAACTMSPAGDTRDAPTTPATPTTAQSTGATQTIQTGSAADAPTTPATEEPAAVRTAFPDLEAPAGEPGLPSITDARPAPGQVVQASGPFDQRFVLEELALDGSTVSGTVRVTSDVSELLALQVLAGFYDADGNLLGIGRFDHEAGSEHTHGGPAEPEPFDIPVPAEFADRAVSAAVGVTVLVNE